MTTAGGPSRHSMPVKARRQRGFRPALTAAALLAGLSIVRPAAPLHAAPIATPQNGEVVGVALGKSQLVHVGRSYAQVLVGDQLIADVLPMPGDTVYVLGKKLGATNLTIYDARHTLVGVLDVVVGPDGAGLRAALAASLPGEAVGVRASGDSLVIDGTVSNAVVAERAARLAETFAPGKIVNFIALGAPQQVLLEVRFSEMQRSTAKALGIRTLALSNAGNFSSATGNSPAESFGQISGSFGIGAVNINLTLDALEQKGLITTLAQPNLIALSGETASFLAGGEFPVPVASTSATTGGLPTITIAFKEFGVSLAFTPTVLGDGRISIVVAPEVSAIDTNASIRAGGISIPGLRTRRARTTLEMRDGESFAIAGLVGADFANSVRQLPLLGDLPILGALFRSTRFDRNETELVITVTPHLVRPVAPAALALPTNKVRPPSEAAQFLLGARDASEVKP